MTMVIFPGDWGVNSSHFLCAVASTVNTSERKGATPEERPFHVGTQDGVHPGLGVLVMDINNRKIP